MPVAWADTAGDGIANNKMVYEHPPTKMESFPRQQINGVMTPVTATTYFSMVFLEADITLTNIGVWIGSTAAVTPTSSWLGLWSHTNFPPIAMTSAGQAVNKYIFSCTRNATTTLTIASGTFPKDLAGRLITGTGITAGTWIVSQPTTTTLLLSAAASGSGTANYTIAQFKQAKTAIAWTTNGATAAIAANVAYTRPLTTTCTIPAAGLYFLSFTFAATTMPTVCCEMHNQTGVPAAVFADPPAIMQSHVSGTTNNTAPGVNPVSGGTSADLSFRPYIFAT